ncbi:MAG: amidohydrolase [Verrucomicrobia bacterium]|nr:amidohydrolase [Verrucomicrobiota bacterium]
MPRLFPFSPAAWLRLAVGLACVGLATGAEVPADAKAAVSARVDAEFPALEAIFHRLHANPELSFQEFETAALVAGELRALGFEVTEKVGNTGVVGVLRNGPGLTVLLRADMDGLPVKERTGLPWASRAVVRDLAGREQPAMHACGHDLHVTGLIGAARILAAERARWAGTLVCVAQPAEEIVAGARAMLLDGLYTRFPRPNFALALHVSSSRLAGEIGYVDGTPYASVSSVDIVVRGVGGHGSQPHTAKDPILLAAQIITALQGIVSREVRPGTPAVVTVGTIQGGTKRNIIPDEVRLELTLRSFDQKVMAQLVAAIRRICAGTAAAAGVPEDRLPVVTVSPESAPVTTNDSALVQRLVGVFRTWFGPERVIAASPSTGAEDFAQYGRTQPAVPIFIWNVGAADPARYAAAASGGPSVPANHSPEAVFVADPTLRTSVASLVAAVLELAPRR